MMFIFIKMILNQPWPGGSVGWSLIPNTKKAAGLVPSRGTCAEHLIDVSLTSLSVDKHILGGGL